MYIYVYICIHTYIHIIYTCIYIYIYYVLYVLDLGVLGAQLAAREGPVEHAGDLAILKYMLYHSIIYYTTILYYTTKLN